MCTSTEFVCKCDGDLLDAEFDVRSKGRSRMPSEPDWGASGFQSIRDELEMSDPLVWGPGGSGVIGLVIL